MESKGQPPPAGGWSPLERERRLAGLAAGQYGVVARRQLIALGFGEGAIKSRLRARRLRSIHRGVYAVGHRTLVQRGWWFAAVLACGEGAVLSHLSAAAAWGLARARAPVDVTSPHGRHGSRQGIRLHRSNPHPSERALLARIPVTSPARTLLDLAETVDEDRFRRMVEEADRLRILRVAELAAVCERGAGRHGVGRCRRAIAGLHRAEPTRSPLEDDFAELCRAHGLPSPSHNVVVLGHEVDALWSRERVVVELDGFEFHGHRAAFERDRARDARMQAAGYTVIRLTHRRLEREPEAVVAELRTLLLAAAARRGRSSEPGASA